MHRGEIIVEVGSSGVVVVLEGMLNPKKAHGSDGISAWVLKENADPLAFPIKEI